MEYPPVEPPSAPPKNLKDAQERIAIRHLEQLRTFSFADGPSEGGPPTAELERISLKVLIQWSKENQGAIKQAVANGK